MNTESMEVLEKKADNAFSAQAPVFDSLYREDAIIQYKRKRVRTHVEQFLEPGSTILELNAGTGEDALYFLKKGHRVHATDISSKMLEQLKAKTIDYVKDGQLSYQKLSYHALEDLAQKGPYDCIFSNFAGLNCTGSLDEVLKKLPALLKTGGMITLVILPEFCLWEFLLLFKGKFRTAFRRLLVKKGGSAAKINQNHFRCWYYNPDYVINCLKESCDCLSVEGLCALVPPSYIEDFAGKYPGCFQWLCKKEMQLKARWPWRSIGDYYIISLRKK